jgi:hypothetical protein
MLAFSHKKPSIKSTFDDTRAQEIVDAPNSSFQTIGFRIRHISFFLREISAVTLVNKLVYGLCISRF